jgi:hypothetical protein
MLSVDHHVVSQAYINDHSSGWSESIIMYVNAGQDDQLETYRESRLYYDQYCPRTRLSDGGSHRSCCSEPDLLAVCDAAAAQHGARVIWFTSCLSLAELLAAWHVVLKVIASKAFAHVG